MSEFGENDEAYWAELEKSPEFQKHMAAMLEFIIGDRIFGKETFAKLDMGETRMLLEEQEEMTEERQLLMEQYTRFRDSFLDVKTVDEFVKVVKKEFGIEVPQADIDEAKKGAIRIMMDMSKDKQKDE